MGKIAKVTDLTKLEGDPNPHRADVSNPRMHLEVSARTPGRPVRAGFIKFVARCSEHSPVAKAIVVSMLFAVGLAAAAGAHFALAGAVPAWIDAAVSLILMLAPAGVYCGLPYVDRKGDC